MNHKLMGVLLGVSLLAVTPVRAGWLDFNLDAEIGYTYLSNITVSDQSTTLKGGVVGARAMLKLLFISLVADWQHFFSQADTFYTGLGAGFGIPLSAVELGIRGSGGLLLLDAAGKALDPKADRTINNQVGIQARAELELDIPLGEWFAVGVVGGFGYHYITGAHGYDFSVLGVLGLRV